MKKSLSHFELTLKQPCDYYFTKKKKKTIQGELQDLLNIAKLIYNLDMY